MSNYLIGKAKYKHRKYQSIYRPKIMQYSLQKMKKIVFKMLFFSFSELLIEKNYLANYHNKTTLNH